MRHCGIRHDRDAYVTVNSYILPLWRGLFPRLSGNVNGFSTIQLTISRYVQNRSKDDYGQIRFLGFDQKFSAAAYIFFFQLYRGGRFQKPPQKSLKAFPHYFQHAGRQLSRRVPSREKATSFSTLLTPRRLFLQPHETAIIY